MNSTASEVIQEITQSVIALVVVAGSIGIGLVLILRGENPNDLPAWLGLALGGVTGFYYGARGNNATVAALTNGPLHLVASMAQRAPQRATDPQPTPATTETPA